MQLLGVGDLVEIGTRQAGGWLVDRNGGRAMSARERMGVSNAAEAPPNSVPGARHSVYTRTRVLYPHQCYELYRKTPDLRACVDGITRRVATWDWMLKTTIDPREKAAYTRAMKEAKRITDWLKVPNVNGYTWQEVMTKWITDLMINDVGVLELVKDGGKLTELAPWLGSTWFPVIDEKGILTAYEQEPEFGVPMVSRVGTIRAPVDSICYLSLFRNNRSEIGLSLIDTVVTECVAVLLSSEHAMKALDSSEIPPGLLVLGGVAGAAADRAKTDLQEMRGKDSKLRVVTSPNVGGVEAKWIELRHTPKELEFEKIVDQMRRAIWRVFGVQPVELGVSEGVTRATANVQVDYASSQLIQPILELVQARINAQIIPLLVPPNLAGQIVFEFDWAQPLTPQQKRDLAQADDWQIARGIVTVNEVRARLGLMPVEGGDVPMVDTNMGPVPLKAIVEGLGPASSYATEKGNTGTAGAVGPAAEPDAVKTRAVGDTDPTNFPEQGDDETVALSNSQWGVFDLRFAQNIKDNYPSIWKKGGNVKGNEQFATLAPIVRRGGDGTPNNDTEEAAIRLREAWGARHRKDFRIAGVVAQIKWLVVGDRGEKYMKDLINEEKSKVDAKKSRAADEDPSVGWPEAERFKGYRTLALAQLADAVAGYTRTAVEVYEGARTEVEAIVRSAYGRDGAITVMDAARAQQQVDNALDRMAVTWASRTSSFYIEAAKIGHQSAERITDQMIAPQWMLSANNFQASAMSWLTMETGLIGGLRSDVRTILARATLEQRDRISEVTPENTETETLNTLREQFDAQSARIANWSGALVGLSNAEMTDAMVRSGVVLDGQPVEWMAEWVTAGGRICPTCTDEGRQGFREVSKMSRRPGENTICRGHCRCVLVFWTKAEVASGVAVKLSSLADG